MLDGPPFPGASNAALNFISHQQNSVVVTNSPQFFHEDFGPGNVSALALHWLDENGGNFLGRQRGLEQFFFDEAGAS